TGQLLRTLREYSSKLAFSRDAKLLASVSSDNSIKVWDATTGQLLRILTGHTQQVGDVVYSSDGRFLASASLDQTIKVWEVAAGRQLLSLAQGRQVLSVA